MTSTDTTQALIGWFEKRDTFSFKDDYHDFVLIEDIPKSEKLRKAAVAGGLAILEENDIVRKVTVDKDEVWVLNKKFSQKIEVSSETSIYLAVIANMIYAAGKHTNVCKPESITEDDLKVVATIAYDFIKKVSEGTGNNQ